MSIEIYWASGSPFAWRVLLALEHKELAYTSHLIAFSNREHKTPAYLALNPRGQVPVLKDGEVVLFESLAILAYLEKQYPEPALFGRSARQTALVWQLVAEQLSYVDAAMEEVILPLFFGGLPQRKESVEGAGRVLFEELGRLDRLLADGRPWIAGDEVTAVDLVTVSEVELVLRAASKDAARSVSLAFAPLPEKLPHLSGWLDCFRALPSYQKTYPPHWKT